MTMILGCIADDFTGATDLAGTLVNEGMRSVQMIGVPNVDPKSVDSEAVIIALKSRSIPVADAIEQSLEALRWLQDAGCHQFIFKYCSTFDSTEKGNIGPVTEALLDALGADFTIACPAFPVNGRTIFKGYLFVGDVLLNESGMQDHPLNPMKDANLVRVLAGQSKSPVGLVPLSKVHEGAEPILEAFNALAESGVRQAIVDATDDSDLRAIGTACKDLALITGGSGIAIGLPENYRQQGLIGPATGAADLPEVEGPCIILSGSCSRATQEQVKIAAEKFPTFNLDALSLAESDNQIAEAITWAKGHMADGPTLIYATANPETVRAAQESLGVERAGEVVEQAFSTIARELVASGARRIIVAGGETSGAVVKELDIEGLHIGKQIDPGVPWTVTLSTPPLALALKSGNFGAPDFFIKAATQ